MSLFATPSNVLAAPQYLRSESVSNCCGAGWITTWPETTGLDKKTVKAYEDQVKKDLDIMDKNRYSISMIVINHHQKKVWGDLIEKYGYKPVVKDKYHTWRGNLLTLYVKPRYKKNKKGDWVDTCKDKDEDLED
jgi:hypothetical protein